MLIFYFDTLEMLPHDPDVRALLRLAALWDIPTANNNASANFLVTSPLMSMAYERSEADLNRYSGIHRSVVQTVLNK